MLWLQRHTSHDFKLTFPCYGYNGTRFTIWGKYVHALDTAAFGSRRLRISTVAVNYSLPTQVLY